MTSCISDQEMQFKNRTETLTGMSKNYRENGLNVGTPEREQLTKQTMLAFECKNRKYDRFGFFGTHIHTIGENGPLLNQKN